MHKLFSILSVGLFRQMFRSATPVALAALGGAMTEHAGIMKQSAGQAEISAKGFPN